MTAKQIQTLFRRIADPKIAEQACRFIKPGEAGYGDNYRFHGIRIPTLTAYLKEFRTLSSQEVLKLLASEYHEESWFALQILVIKFQRGTERERKSIYDLYLKNSCFINSWDLVDNSAHKILGPFLENRSRRPLYRMAKSSSLWERRIAIMSTFHFIRNNDFGDTLEIAGLLINDKEDLVHKAVGWMLREVGNRDPAVEKKFLSKFYKRMPRTMLRYAIEKFPQVERKLYLTGKI